MSLMRFSTKLARRVSRQSSLTCSTPPNSRIAARRASCGVIPAARFSSTWRSMWNRSSVPSSCSTAFLRNRERTKFAIFWTRRMARSSLNGLQDEPNRRRESFPVGLFGFEIFLSGARQGIIFRAAIVFRLAPFRLNPSLLFEPMQSGVKCALIHLQNVVRNAANALRNGPTVHGLEGDRLKDEQIESALDEVGGFGQEASP